MSISTRLIVIIHAKEWRKSTNTGHFARLAINTGEVRVQGRPNRPISSEGIDCCSASNLVLYPGRGARPLTAEFIASLARPLTLLVPDGNWTQAKNMMRRLPMLSQAHPVRLEGPSLDVDCLRHNTVADRMSTFEAIAQALGILEGDNTKEQLLEFFRQVVDGMVPNSRKAARRKARRDA